ncbi:MAG: hypothetical protein ACRBM6_26215 [Geminicoccales bacterium]
MDTSKNLTDHRLDSLEGRFLTGQINRRHFIQASVALGVSLTASSTLADALDDARANQDARAADMILEV